MGKDFLLYLPVGIKAKLHQQQQRQIAQHAKKESLVATDEPYKLQKGVAVGQCAVEIKGVYL